MAKKALVTGGAGFIGSHLSRRLLKEGWDVVIADNLSSGQERNVPKEAEFKRLDLTQEEVIDQLPANGVDAVFHLASHVGQELSFERPLYDIQANAFSTMLLLKWCQEKKVKHFIFASSMNVYGDPPELPVTETTLVQPPSPYAVGKIASEYLCRIYQNFGIHSTSLRLFNVYGPGQDMKNMKQGMVSIFMTFVAQGKPILVRGAKDRFRDFIFVDDVVDAFVRCLDPRASGKVYNIATGRKTHVWQLLDEIVKAFGHKPGIYPITFGDSTPRDQFGVWGDSSLIQKDLGWKSTISLEKGIPEMVSWVKTLKSEDFPKLN
jgi:UDP-glucose 4-epimerase